MLNTHPLHTHTGRSTSFPFGRTENRGVLLGKPHKKTLKCSKKAVKYNLLQYAFRGDKCSFSFLCVFLAGESIPFSLHTLNIQYNILFHSIFYEWKVPIVLLVNLLNKQFIWLSNFYVPSKKSYSVFCSLYIFGKHLDWNILKPFSE